MKMIVLRLVALSAALAATCFAGSDFQLPLGLDESRLDSLVAAKRVDVSIGVMSKCPDALFFENAFAKTVERVNQKINLSLHYIATPDDSSPFGATCMHGDDECQGNIHQLCVIDTLNPEKAGKRYDLGPSAAQRLWWDFVQCENYVGGKQRIGQESLAKQCLKAIGGVPDWQDDGLEECAQGKKGRALLKKSIEEAHKLRIEKSATLLIEGKPVCIRDGNQWKDCSAGHETIDWVRQIEEAYNYKNSPSRTETILDGHYPATRIFKRQQADNSTVPPPNGGVGQQPPAGAPPNAGTQGQGAPLSVFAFVKGLSGILSRYLTFDRFGLSQIVPTHTSLDSKSSLFLQPRQIFGNNTVNPANNPFNNGGFPVPYLAFGIAAIALFVLVVAFVLLRIFVRNRRLRRMGIYPEGPIDRLLGGNFREFDDNLPPPRLWEAKITDIGAGMTEKHGLDGEKANSIDTKGYGWDALMPVSAALPPNLYPIIFQADQKNHSSSFEPPSTYPPPPSNQHTARLGRHMPQFLRRQTGDAADPNNGATNVPPSATTAEFPNASASNAEKAEEKLAASVNVTVLIAMPSSRTIFPSSRRVASSMSNNATDSLRQPSAALTTTDTKLPEVEEDITLDQDESSMKGKARRAPSLRSVKSTASLKSVAETRREAFFNQITKDDAGKDIPSENIVATPAPAYEEEEEELPELMFGTASVPIFTHLATNTTSRRQSLTPSSHVMQPNRSDILGLVAAANKARERKTEVDAAAAGAKTKKQQDEADLEVNRLSVAETSLDGEARTGLNDRSEDDALQTPMADQNPGQQFEMTTMGPSRSSYYSTEMPTPSTPTPLLSMASPFGTAPKTPTSSMPLVSSGLKEQGHRT